MVGFFKVTGVVLAVGSSVVAAPLALVGATVVDVRSAGKGTADLVDAVILLDGDRIVSVSSRSKAVIPPGAQRIDARGTYAVPGLIDGYGALRNEAFGKAYLHDGVTTVYVPTMLPGDTGDAEEVVFEPAASSGPRVFRGAPMSGYLENGFDISQKPLTKHRLEDARLGDEQLRNRVKALAAKGIRGLTLGYDLWPDQVDTVMAEARKLGLATLGTLAFTSYPYAARAGVHAFVRNDHYQTELATSPAKLAYSDDPRGMGGKLAFEGLCAAEPTGPVATAMGTQLAETHTALMPVLAIEATADALEVPNPWSAPSAKLIAAKDLDSPPDVQTGASRFLAQATPEKVARVRRCALRKQKMDGRFHALGVTYLAGSGAPAFGIMPGSGLTLEMALLARIGLTPREALASATGNFAQVYGWKDVGLLEAGRKADVLLLSVDPREDVHAVEHIRILVAAGKVVAREGLLR